MKSSGEISTVAGARKPLFRWDLWHLAALGLPQWDPPYAPGVPGPDHRGPLHPVLPRFGGLALCPHALNSEHEGGRDWGQQTPLTSSQDSKIQFLLSHHVLLTRASQEAQHLLFDAGPPCPNKLLGKTGKRKDQRRKREVEMSEEKIPTSWFC